MDLSMRQIIRDLLSLTGSQIRQLQADDLVALIVVLFLSVSYYLKGILWAKPDPYHHLWFEKPQGLGVGSQKRATRDIAEKLQQDNRNVAILWGSQSGTAESFANRLVLDCKRRFGLSAVSLDLADYDPDTISRISQSTIVIFIISTYGEGDPSDNTTSFLSGLSRNETVQFANLNYAAFGLGNKNYKYYNRVIDVVTQALDRLQAKALLPVGKADDSKGTTEEDFTEWRDSLFSMFRVKLGLEERPEQYEPTLRIVEDESLSLIDLHIGQPSHPKSSRRAAASHSVIRPLPISDIRKLFATKTRDCLHLELDISEFPELKYKTGDHLAIWPSNPSIEVDRLLCVLGLSGRAQVPLLISSLDPTVETKVPSPTTAEVLFRYYLEICGPVSRQTVLSLAPYAPSPASKARFTQLGQDKDAYNNYCTTNFLNLGRLLESVLQPGESWTDLPLSFVFESLRPISPRYYSISSSSIVHPRQIAVTVSVSLFDDNGTAVPGLTTGYLSDLEGLRNITSTSAISLSSYILDGPSNILQNGKLFAHIRKSKFRLPALGSTPIIMVASGSGIAPFRGFLQERARMTAMGREIGKTVLFFGCRRAEEDYIYREELNQINEQLGDRMALITAFSREEVNNNGGRMYVQDRVEEHADIVKDLMLESNGYFYICGSASMSRGVWQKLGECIRLSQGWDESELREWSEQMKKSHRWQEDVWG
ncbi:putative NADPH-cytochrome P450 reductase [Xylogone sp. PMI_703]|nr:putative NADPH-cytochrome P450 reductase [Xylogone sp. PMI_703]